MIAPARVATLVIFVLATLGTGVFATWPYAPLVGWDAAALWFIAWVWSTVMGMGASQTEAHATRESPGRAASELIILCSAVASLVGVGYVLVRANSAHGVQQSLLAALGIVSVVLSWFAIHTLFALRYALLYYKAQDRPIDFKSQIPPRYLDFAYLAFTLGMTFQVSDTDLRSPTLRATALRHALLSYLFGAVILASMINLVVSLGGGQG